MAVPSVKSPGVLASGSLAAVLMALVAACGGGGTSAPACQTETTAAAPTPSPAASLTLSVASYEGTGSSQCIRGLGFQPVLVIIKSETAEFAVWRSSSMEGDSTADFASGAVNFEGGITSLDPDAFSLGNGTSVNEEGVTYHYVAFADSPDIKVGSYAGDGTEGRSITDVGFEPAVLFVKRDGARAAVWTSASHSQGVASAFHGGDDVSGFVRGLESDGFRVGSDPFVNAGDGSIYHYAAFRETPGRLQTGTYIGDGSDNRDIDDVGFQPDYVWIKRSSAESKAVHRTSSVSGDSTLRFAGLANGEDEIQALQPDGFQVGTETAVNFDGDTYNYVAFKASSGP